MVKIVPGQDLMKVWGSILENIEMIVLKRTMIEKQRSI